MGTPPNCSTPLCCFHSRDMKYWGHFMKVSSLEQGDDGSLNLPVYDQDTLFAEVVILFIK